MANLRIISRKKKLITPLIDFCGKCIFTIFNFSKAIRQGNKSDTEIRRILITRLDPIGDVVLSTSIIKPLRNKFPEAILTYMVSSQAKDIIEGNPHVDEIITYDAFWHFSKGVINDIRNYVKMLKMLRAKKFDLALDLEGNAKSIFFISYMSKIPVRVGRDWTGGGYLLTKVVPWVEKKHMIEYQADIARAVGVEIDDHEMFIYIGSKEKEFVCSLFKNEGINDSDSLVVLSPAARRITKVWSAERFAKIGDWLVRIFGSKIIITGAPNEIDVAGNVKSLMEEDAHVFVGKTRTLKHLAVVMERASLVIGNDSGPMHVAAAMKTPTVTLFSSGLPSEYRPYGDMHKVIQRGDLSCRPCTERKCVRPEGFCMELITIEDVQKTIKEQMKVVGLNHSCAS